MEEEPETEIIHRDLDTDIEEPATQIVEAVCEIEEADVSEVSTIWSCVDGILDNLFSTPPADEAQMEIEFSYEGYRVTVEQNGRAEFVKTG